LTYKTYNGPDYSNPDHQAYLERLCRKEVRRMKPVWLMKEFWLPFITGLAGTVVFTVFYYTGIEISAEPIIGLILGALGTWLGLNNANDKNKHD